MLKIKPRRLLMLILTLLNKTWLSTPSSTRCSNDTILKPLSVNVISRQDSHNFRIGNIEIELDKTYNVIRVDAEAYAYGMQYPRANKFIV